MALGAVFHAGVPSLRLILADAFFFVLNVMAALVMLAAIAITIAIIAAPFVWLFIFISKFVRFVAP